MHATASRISTVSDLVQFRDLEFARLGVPGYSSRGSVFMREVAVGMPRIPTKVLDVVCYLYRDEVAAQKGENFGGTAFLIGVPSALPGRAFMYAVTNWHVACQNGFSALRINTKDGKTDVFPFGPEDWHFDTKYDIAVINVPINSDIHKYAVLGTSAFTLQDHVEKLRVGPGDDVFMVGRFVDHDGGAINRPAVRFGSISVMPTPIEQPNGGLADCYCIDVHSRSGYSGSPVFIYRTAISNLDFPKTTEPEEDMLLLAGTEYLALLGIHFAQFPEEWELREGAAPAKRPDPLAVPLIREGAYVRGLSGMTCVLPAWCILEVLNMPRLKESRDRANAILLSEAREQGRTQPQAETALSEEEIVKRRDDAIRRALNTPPSPRTRGG